MIPKPKPIRNPEYLKWIKSLKCLICHSSSPSAHHIPPKGNSGKGTKTDDTRTIPLCHKHHEEYHRIGRGSFERRYLINYENCIERLNRVWDNIMSQHEP